jgi:hypothetical protein
MADYASDYTRRIRVQYSGPRGTHKMQFRNYGLLSTNAGLIAGARAAVVTLATLQFPGTVWNGAEIADAGSEIFLPVTWGADITAAAGPAATNTDPFGAYLQFTARSTGGSRVSFYLYNVSAVHLTANNRLTLSEEAGLAAIWTALEDATNGLTAIDGNSFVCKRYANTKINSHIARISRAAA